MVEKPDPSSIQSYERAFELGTNPEVLAFIDSHRPYLGGIVEVAGGFYFHKSNNWAPSFSLGDNDLQSLTALADSLDARSHKIKGGNSWDLQLYKRGVVCYLADAIGNYAPSRAAVFTALANWQETENPEERAAIVALYRDENPGRSRSVDLSPTVYVPLIQIPAFCAGVFDARASIEINKNLYPFFNFTSSNKALLVILQQRFGGNLSLNTKAGEAITISGRTFNPKQDSWEWKIMLHNEVRDFLTFIKDDVIGRRPQLETALALLER